MKQAFVKTSGRLRNSSTSGGTQQQSNYSNYFYTQKPWLNLQYNDPARTLIRKPAELENEMTEPPAESIDEKILDKIQGSIIGMALGDALGAHVEFRPRQYLLENRVKDLEGGGTWGLQKGQFTDDTSMALCLANSLVTQCRFNPYDQLVRYKWWYRYGYMSSTGKCFDIGAATSHSISEFEQRQIRLGKKHSISPDTIDYINNDELLKEFNAYCSQPDVAGNGALMRLAPVPLFFFRHPVYAIEYSGISGQITHGDRKAYDACRYYGALIVAALRGCNKKDLLDKKFYSKHKDWFGKAPLCSEIMSIAEGSFKNKGGYDAGIRGKGYIVDALEAALWAFWSDEDSFEKGALAAVNLGDDTDTTAAIYGQLAGAYYGYKKLPPNWLKHVYAEEFMKNLSKWIVYEGQNWEPPADVNSFDPSRISDPYLSQPPFTNISNTATCISEHADPGLLKHRDSQLNTQHNIPSIQLQQTNSNPKVSTVPKLPPASTGPRPTDRKSSRSIPHGGPLRATQSVGSQKQSTSVAGPTGNKAIETNSKSPSRPVVNSTYRRPIVSGKSPSTNRLANHQPDIVGYQAPLTVTGTSPKKSSIKPNMNNGISPAVQEPELYHIPNVEDQKSEQRPAGSIGTQNRSSRQETTKTGENTKKQTGRFSRKNLR